MGFTPPPVNIDDVEVPPQDSSDNILSRDVVGNKTDTANATGSLVRMIKYVISSLGSIFGVPTQDSAANTDTSDVVGNKTDTVAGNSLVALNKQVKAKTDNLPTDPADQSQVESAITTAHTTTDSKIDVIDGYHDVPTADSADNAQMRDVIGNKTDTHDGNSIRALTHTLEEHIHKDSKCYPTGANPVTVTCGDSNPWVLGAFVEIVPANAIASDFDIHFINAESISANGSYELVIYAVATEIGRLRFARSTNQVRANGLPFQCEIQPANTQIRAKIMSSTGVANTADISIFYHIY